MDIPPGNLQRVVIVGGGFAGIELAKQLHNRFQVVLIDKNNFHPFQPLLYQVATAGVEPDSVVFPLRKIFSGYREFYFRLTEAQEILPGKNILVTPIGDLQYDYLVLATGSDTNFFGMKETQKFSLAMKTVREALDLRSCILQNFEMALIVPDMEKKQALMNYVIVGGGPTGVELAGALAELRKHVLPNDYPELDLMKMEIHLVDTGARLLGTMDERSSLKAEKFLRDMGVDVLLNTRITGYDGKTATTDTGKMFSCATLIWAAGVKGVPLKGIPENALLPNGRIKVDAFGKVNG
ncbi:MAG TPA: FAD-dependent oxidoreductase, partial [Bacteroidia bacterium]|nr:FAD-dependent oxidoreductase [Bacteroidia bacterium]